MAVAPLVLILALLGCTPSDPPAARSASPPVPASASPSPLVTDSSVDIGGGRHINLSCTGEGSPTVLFESGDTAAGSQWLDVVVGVGSTTRACSYDRLGTGLSDNATGCRRMKDLQADFTALLQAADLKPPYVVAGTSGGGFLAAYFAMAHPRDVRGLLLADTPTAIDLSEASPGLREDLKCTSPTNAERRDFAQVEHAAWDHRRAVPGLGLTVITYRDADADPGTEEATSVRDQRGWLVLNPEGKQVVVTSGHDIPGREAALTVKEIVALVDSAR